MVDRPTRLHGGVPATPAVVAWGMTSLEPQLRQVWQHHEAVDRALLRALDSDDLPLATPAGGWTIEQQLAHIGAVVAFWSGRLVPATVVGLPRIDPDEPRVDAFEHDIDVATSFIERANAAALDAAGQVDDWSDRSHLSAGSFLTHMMVHAAHHRAQVLLALKEAGEPLPDDGAVWGPWKRNPEA